MSPSHNANSTKPSRSCTGRDRIVFPPAVAALSSPVPVSYSLQLSTIIVTTVCGGRSVPYKVGAPLYMTCPTTYLIYLVPHD